MSHWKIQSTPTNWPTERKGRTYVVKPRFSAREGVPVLVILRDMMKIAQDRSEVKRIIHLRQILVNERLVRDERNNLLFFDTINIAPLKEQYRLELNENGKFFLNKIEESEANKKVAKIIGKKMLKGKKTQLNLSDGRNFLSDIKCNIGDSVEINLKEGKIEKCLPMKEKENVIIFAGKHVGKKGRITSLNLEEKTAKVKIGEKEINILINQLMVIE
jgi:small subunit ribosomal protein S4e